jgi:transposase
MLTDGGSPREQEVVRMPKAYSLDLRERVIAACEAGDHPRAAVARQFNVAESTLYEWQRRYRAEGVLEPRPHSGGTYKLAPD